MAKIDIDDAPQTTGSSYPAAYAAEVAGRSIRRLGDAAGLTQFGANLVTLEDGAAASLRHWHSSEDEFAIVTEGELILQEDAGETALRAGDCAAWRAGDANGHRFVNRSGAVARFLVVGTKAATEITTYSDVDMVARRENGAKRLTYHDGSEWAGPRDLAKGDEQ